MRVKGRIALELFYCFLHISTPKTALNSFRTARVFSAVACFIFYTNSSRIPFTKNICVPRFPDKTINASKIYLCLVTSVDIPYWCVVRLLLPDISFRCARMSKVGAPLFNVSTPFLHVQNAATLINIFFIIFTPFLHACRCVYTCYMQ